MVIIFDLLVKQFLEYFVIHWHLHPCKKCKRECVGHRLMDCIQCDVCSKWQHASCATLDFPFELYVERDLPYYCSLKCELTLLPFNYLNNVKEYNRFKQTELDTVKARGQNEI